MCLEDDLPYLDTLDPADQLRVIACAIEEAGDPADYARTVLLRSLIPPSPPLSR